MEHRVSKQIMDSWVRISKELPKYHSAVEVGFSHVKLLVAHRTTFNSVGTAEIEDTNLCRQDPDAKLKLQHAIRKEIDTEKNILLCILKELDLIFIHITKECDRAFSLREGLELNEMTAATETTSSIADMLAALDRFKAYFYDDHIARKCSIDGQSMCGASEDVLKLWDSSELQNVAQDVGSVFSE